MAKAKKSDATKLKPAKERKLDKKPAKAARKKSTAITAAAPAPATISAVAAAVAKPRRTTRKPPAAAPAATGISPEEIGLRAYYIAERRRAMNWPGDELSDWVEAERQLKAEALRKARTTK